jgi:hypothetical protein
MNLSRFAEVVMCRVVVVGLAAGGITAIAALASAAPRPKEPVKAPLYFPTAIGTEWVYQQGEWEVTKRVTAVERGTDMTVVTVDRVGSVGRPTRSDQMGVSEAGVFWIGSLGPDPLKPDRPACWLNLKHAPGGEWMSAGSQHPYVARKPEWVEVPAGRFLAIPVEVTYTSGSGKLVKQVSWYAPEVGLVKEQVPSEDKPRVLKSFRPGKE